MATFEPLDLSSFGVLIVNAQNDYHDSRGNCPKPNTVQVNNAIAQLLMKQSLNIQDVMATCVDIPTDSLEFAENWRYVGNANVLRPGDTIVRGAQGYEVNCNPVEHRYHPYTDLETSTLTVTKKCFRKYTVGWSLDDDIMTVVGPERDVLFLEYTSGMNADVYMKGRMNYRNLIVVGHFHDPFVYPFLSFAFNHWKKSGLNIWMVEDLCPGKESSRFPPDLCKRVYSYDVFKQPFNVRGIPVHIQPQFHYYNNYLSSLHVDVIEQVRSQWARQLSTLQHLNTHLRMLEVAPRAKFICVNKQGEEVDPSHPEAECMERVTNPSVLRDPNSREIYNVYLRGNRRSFIHLGYGIPPIENPYGIMLMPGRGRLPFFGPNHHFVWMKVVNSKDKPTQYIFEDDNEFSYSMLSVSSYLEKKKYGDDKPKMVVYQGYYPHVDNTRHAWRECIVLAVDEENAYGQATGAYEGIQLHWIQSFEYVVDSKTTSAVHISDLNPVYTMIKTWENSVFKEIFSEDLYQFMTKGLHINNGEELLE